MAELKTQPSDIDPIRWLQAVEPPRRRAEGLALAELFGRVTGWAPRIWGDAIVGYGAYDYTYASGRTGRWMATGFSPRKGYMSVYIMPGYAEFGDILDRLGPHRKGKACLNITRLDRIDMEVLAELIATGLEDLRRRWPVHPA